MKRKIFYEKYQAALNSGAHLFLYLSDKEQEIIRSNPAVSIPLKNGEIVTLSKYMSLTTEISKQVVMLEDSFMVGKVLMGKEEIGRLFVCLKKMFSSNVEYSGNSFIEVMKKSVDFMNELYPDNKIEVEQFLSLQLPSPLPSEIKITPDIVFCNKIISDALLRFSKLYEIKKSREQLLHSLICQ